MRLAAPACLAALSTLTAIPARAQLKPAIRASLVPEAARFLNIEEVLSDAPIRLDWTATVNSLDTYEYEISYDAGRSMETTTSTLVKLDDNALEAGRNRGTVQNGRMERFHIRPSQIIDPSKLPGQTGAVDNDRRNIVLRVFRSSNPLEAATSETFAWTFDYDTRSPPPPVLSRLLPGENRLQVEWTPPSPDSDVDTYEVLFCPDVTGAASGEGVLQSLPCSDPKSVTGIGKEQTSFSVETDIRNGVPAAVALRSVDPFGNKGDLSGIGVETPSEVSDFFELYKELGGKEEGGFCFIASAAYGSYAHPAVRILRLFRDLVLKRSPAGTALVWVYYRLSPPLAAAVRADPRLARFVRIALLPVTGVAALWVLAPLAGLAFAGSLVFRSARARPRGRRHRRVAAVPVASKLAALSVVGLATALPSLLGASPALARPPRAKSELRYFGLGLELKGGPYLPVLGEKGGGPEGVDAFRRVFGSDHNPLYTIGMDFQLYRGIGTAGVGGTFGFMQFVGKSFFGVDGARASDTTVFNILPLSLTAFYRFDWLADRASVPLVPYARGGLAYDFWWVTTGTGDIARFKGADPISRDDDVRGRGGKLGLTASVGMSFLLNVIEPLAAANLYESTSIRGTYLFAEYQFSKVDGLGKDGFDLSDNTWNLGLYVEL